jgi:putative glutathione S-transferase
MGLLIDGVWHDRGYDTGETGGRFVRSESQFRDWVTADGSSGFPAAPGRYHLYVSLACPWAHRTLVFRKLKRLEQTISLSIVDWYMGQQGWAFSEREGCIPDHVNGARYLHQVYAKARPGYTGRVTVPVLWDRETGTIVNNESAEIIRMFNSAFDRWGDAGLDFYPAPLRREIDAVNAFVCNRHRLVDYSNLWGYARELYQVPGVAETVNMRHIKGHYYESHRMINPTGIVPKGPAIDFSRPHDRARLAAE